MRNAVAYYVVEVKNGRSTMHYLCGTGGIGAASIVMRPLGRRTVITVRVSVRA